MSLNDDRSCSCSGVAFFLAKGFTRPRLLTTISSNLADSITLIWTLILVPVVLSQELVLNKEVGMVSACTHSSAFCRRQIFKESRKLCVISGVKYILYSLEIIWFSWSLSLVHVFTCGKASLTSVLDELTTACTWQLTMILKRASQVSRRRKRVRLNLLQL